MEHIDWQDVVRAAFPAATDPDPDVVLELAQHAAAMFADAIARSCPEADARASVETQVASWVRDPAVLRHRSTPGSAPVPPPADSATPLAGLAGDIRYALQLLRRNAAHALLVVATLALGVGASTFLASVAYSLLAKPLPWPDADRLVRLYETRRGSSRPPTFFTNATYLAWADHPSTVESLAAWSEYPATLTGAGAPARIRIVEATPSLFAVLGARPALGTVFRGTSGRSSDTARVVLSHALWQEHFGGDSNALGRVFALDGAQYRVVGVMPPDFLFPDPEARAWIPFDVPPVAAPGQAAGRLSMFSALARLRPGVTPAAAAAEAAARGRHAPDPGLVTMAVFGSRGPVQVSAVPLLDSLVGSLRPALLVLLAAVALLLLTATANVASLQLARATARRREMAVREAVGAGPGRLARQLLVENIVLGQIGGLAGLALAISLLWALPSALPAAFPRLTDITVDWRVAVISVALSLLASVMFGLAPVLHARRLNLVESLNEDALAPAGGGSRTRVARTRLTIMAGQIAAATVLLVGAVLLARGVLTLLSADRGYDPSALLTARVVLPDADFTPQARADSLERLLARARGLPGVTAAAYATTMPLAAGGHILASFPVPGRRGAPPVQAHAVIRQVSPGYFSALRLRMVAGRAFTDADTTQSGEVIVVNRAFASQYLDPPAVGTRLQATQGQREVVGVVENLHDGALSDPPQPELYVATRQLASGFDFENPALLVRTSADPARLAPALRVLARELGPSVVLESVMTMEDRLRTSLAPQRLAALLAGGFAAFALAIAGVGLFGVLGYSVSLRSREIGVRRSLGATPARVVLLVLRQALVVTLAGLTLGIAAAATLLAPLSHVLYGVTAPDVATCAAVSVLLLLVALVACLGPARRAARLDPARVLR